MTPSVFWLIAMVLFGVAEAATVGLVSIWFVLGSAAALLTSYFTGNLWIQAIVFLAVSLAALAALRPLAQRLLASKSVPTNCDRVIGAGAVVTEDIDNLNGCGAVVVGGVTWTARSEQPDKVIPKGTHVQVLWIEGVKVFVKEIEPKQEEVTVHE